MLIKSNGSSFVVGDVVGHTSAPEVTSDPKERVVDHWTDIDKNLSQGLHIA
ncbi:hypothetical protein [Microtetraspora sp. AC03309]|uniref:hypothetical protein n=1 Tax=Microtetraspora sp. AC03309 TaxID=2779376 RepID=UPI001E4E9924|nr:hypothetical protein [Microtetraspora sp. AC03309]